MAEDAFNKFKKTITKSVVAVNVKTSVYLETSKLRLQISTLEKEIQEQFTALGKSTYLQWSNDNIEVEKFSALMESIKEKYLKIDSINAHIEELEKHETDVFGSKDGKTEETSSEQTDTTVFTCSKCSTQYTTEIKFCKKCGNKMI